MSVVMLHTVKISVHTVGCALYTELPLLTELWPCTNPHSLNCPKARRKGLGQGRKMRQPRLLSDPADEALLFTTISAITTKNEESQIETARWRAHRTALTSPATKPSEGPIARA
jgi:hypothetical protein